jgi:hypothetical protein
MSQDPLLQPYQLKHLTLKNRIMTTSHEPAYPDDGMPKDRYRLYHLERAKAGVALTMTAGSAAVSRDSPPVFSNILAWTRTKSCGWMKRLADDCHDQGCACDDPAVPPWPPYPLGQGRLAAGHLGQARTRTIAPRLSQDHRRLGYRAHCSRLRRRHRTDERGGPRWGRVRMLWPSDGPVHVPPDQRAARPYGGSLRKPGALCDGGSWPPAANGWARNSCWACAMAADEMRIWAALPKTKAWRSPNCSRCRRTWSIIVNINRGRIHTDPAMTDMIPIQGMRIGAASGFRRPHPRRGRPAHIPRRAHPRCGNRASCGGVGQVGHGRHDPRPYGRPPYRAEDHRGTRGRHPPLCRGHLLP